MIALGVRMLPNRYSRFDRLAPVMSGPIWPP